MKVRYIVPIVSLLTVLFMESGYAADSVVPVTTPSSITQQNSPGLQQDKQERREGWRLVKTLRKTVKEDKARLEGDTTKLGGQSAEAQKDREQLQQDRKALKQARIALRTDREKVKEDRKELQNGASPSSTN